MSAAHHKPAWSKIRPVILERDGYQCRIRGPGCTGRATQVDHILPLHQGGAPYDPANLRAACAQCNLSRSNPLKTEPPQPPPKLNY